MPEHAPDHPAKFVVAPGISVSVTVEFAGKEYVQVEPQLMPEGLLETVPVPVPDLVTVRVTVAGPETLVLQSGGGPGLKPVSGVMVYVEVPYWVTL